MSDSPLVDEFEKERKDKKIINRLVHRNEFIDPKPIAIKDQFGEKIASYELDMVRWGLLLLYMCYQSIFRVTFTLDQM